MLSSKWQSTKTSIKLLIEETVGWGRGACFVVCVGMTELVSQRWEVTETCQRSQSARGQPFYAVNPHCSFVAALIDAKCINTDKMHSWFNLNLYTTPFYLTTSYMLETLVSWTLKGFLTVNLCFKGRHTSVFLLIWRLTPPLFFLQGTHSNPQGHSAVEKTDDCTLNKSMGMCVCERLGRGS